MTKCNTKADTTLRQIKVKSGDKSVALITPLNVLEDRLGEFLASLKFYHCAIRHLTEPEHLEGSEDWHGGLFLQQQQLLKQADSIMASLLACKQQMGLVSAAEG